MIYLPDPRSPLFPFRPQHDRRYKQQADRDDAQEGHVHGHQRQHRPDPDQRCRQKNAERTDERERPKSGCKATHAFYAPWAGSEFVMPDHQPDIERQKNA